MVSGKGFGLAVCAALILGGGLASAQSAFDNQLKARQGLMRLVGWNVGVLGGMARGKVEYNAEEAQAAADNLVALSKLHQAPLWPSGSDNFDTEGTRALPAIWESPADFQAKWQEFGTAVSALQQVAGNGAEGLGAAVGPVGGTCKSCHEKYQAPRE